MDGNPKLEIACIGIGGKTIPGYYVAFSHSGATLGLIVGELLAYEIATGAEHPMLAKFRPERFASQ